METRDLAELSTEKLLEVIANAQASRDHWLGVMNQGRAILRDRDRLIEEIRKILLNREVNIRYGIQ